MYAQALPALASELRAAAEAWCLKVWLAPKDPGDDRRNDNKNDLHWQVKDHREASVRKGFTQNDHTSNSV